MSNIAMATRTKRDSRVELLRLFACFSVLVLHFKPNTFVAGRRILSRTFITCMCTDAVGIFLLITGFFFFGRQSLPQRMASYIRKILLPTFVYTFFVAAVYPVIIGVDINYGKVAEEFATTVMTWNPVIHNAQHLWFMYLYGMLAVARPLLKWIKEKLLDTVVKQVLFISCVLVLLTANDISGNNILKSEMVPVTVFVPGCLFIITGGLIYEHRRRFQNKTLPAIVSLMIFVAVTVVRSVYMRSALDTDSSATHMYGWYTSAGFVCAVALAIFVISLKPFTSDVVNTLAANTMDIYILHPLVSEIITVLGRRGWVIATFLDGSENIVQFLKFTIIYCTLVFAVCSVVAMGIKTVLSVFKRVK